MRLFSFHSVAILVNRGQNEALTNGIWCEVLGTRWPFLNAEGGSATLLKGALRGYFL
jgi:hypothetical protein